MITAGPITVDPETREARVHGHKLLLTMGEFDLLRVLASDPERLWTHRELLHLVPRAREMSETWLDLRAGHLTAQLLRVGVATDITNHRGFHGGKRAYRLFIPVEEAQAAAGAQDFTLAADRAFGGRP